jgi:predicted chitinase
MVLKFLIDEINMKPNVSAFVVIKHLPNKLRYGNKRIKSGKEFSIRTTTRIKIRSEENRHICQNSRGRKKGKRQQ